MFDQKPGSHPESSTRKQGRLGRNLDPIRISLLRACILYNSRDTRADLCVSGQLLAFRRINS